MDSILLVLGVALGFVFGWNNSSILIGNIRAAGSLPYKIAVALSSAGLFLGALVEGNKMNTTFPSLVSSVVYPQNLFATLLVSLLVTLFLTVLSLPVSFSIVMIGSFIGSGIVYGEGIRSGQLLLVVLFWFLAPALSGLLSVIIHRAIKELAKNVSITTVDTMNRAGVFVSSLLASYSLGSNNIGLIESTVTSNPSIGILILVMVGSIAGTALFGGTNVSSVIGDRLMSLSPQSVFSVFIASSVSVWLGTQLAIPISISQCLLGGMLGYALTRRFAVLNKKLAVETVLVWLVAPVASFILSALLSLLL